MPRKPEPRFSYSGLPETQARCGPRQRLVGHGVVVFAVGPPGNRTTAEVKIRARRSRTASSRSPGASATDLFGRGETWVGEGGCLGARQGGLFRRRRDGGGA